MIALKNMDNKRASTLLQMALALNPHFDPRNGAIATATLDQLQMAGQPHLSRARGDDNFTYWVPLGCPYLHFAPFSVSWVAQQLRCSATLGTSDRRVRHFSGRNHSHGRVRARRGLPGTRSARSRAYSTPINGEHHLQQILAVSR